MSDGKTSEAENSGSDGGDREESSILEDGGIDTDERAGRSQGIDPHSEPDEETQQEIEAEREERLDPDNRPEHSEVDNTQRDFDVDRGLFTDSEDYDDSEPAPFSDPEDPNNEDNKDSEDTEDSDSDDTDDS
jgi:hypothetical protein